MLTFTYGNVPAVGTFDPAGTLTVSLRSDPGTGPMSFTRISVRTVHVTGGHRADIVRAADSYADGARYLTPNPTDEHPRGQNVELVEREVARLRELADTTTPHRPLQAQPGWVCAECHWTTDSVGPRDSTPGADGGGSWVVSFLSAHPDAVLDGDGYPFLTGDDDTDDEPDADELTHAPDARDGTPLCDAAAGGDVSDDDTAVTCPLCLAMLDTAASELAADEPAVGDSLLPCGGRPGDFLHRDDGAHRSTPTTTDGRTLDRFEREWRAHRTPGNPPPAASEHVHRADDDGEAHCRVCGVVVREVPGTPPVVHSTGSTFARTPAVVLAARALVAGWKRRADELACECTGSCDDAARAGVYADLATRLEEVLDGRDG